MWQMFKLRLALIMVFGTLTLGFVMIFALNPSVNRYNDELYFNPPTPYPLQPTSLPPRAIMTMTELGNNLTRTQNAFREQTLGATLTPTPIMRTLTPTDTHSSITIVTSTLAPQSLTVTAIVQTQTAQAEIEMTLTQAVQNATAGTLSLIVTPEATPTP